MNKGITPVLAVILLLLITVVIVGFAFGFFQKIMTATTQKASEQVETGTEQMTGVVRIENVNSISVTVRNTGVTSINTATLVVYVDNESKTCTWDKATIDSSAFASCTVASGTLCTTTQTVKVSSTATEDTSVCP
ncbi:MAG: hypothetical protein J4473_01810 [Candidatus Aenigmarchaeota archaeon]|nr:hypothetical protein [Candidatus Aenigmarchaeota archaeon]